MSKGSCNKLKEERRWYQRRRTLLYCYGMTLRQYEILLGAQLGGCAVCGKPPTGTKPLAVDHNHKTGEVRGLLCSRCNCGLGYIEHSDWLAKAVNYLKGKRLNTREIREIRKDFRRARIER